jgi:hypothetical protein
MRSLILMALSDYGNKEKVVRFLPDILTHLAGRVLKPYSRFDLKVCRL